jgi:hypothetical protein
MDLQDLLGKSGLQSKKVEIPSSMDATLARSITTHQLIYSLAGLLMGLACIVGGLVLALRGVTGSAGWTAKVLGLESELTDAAPGVVLFVVGIFMVWVTRYNVKARK